MQSAKNILLIKPAHFAFNTETATSNAFQSQLNETENTIKQKALAEFEVFAETLQSKGVNVFIFHDTPHPQKPDAIFPNNWISTHTDGSIILYPMCAPNRRQERRMDIIDSLKKKFKVSSVIDLSENEKKNRFLEGTGSIVFDRKNKIGYACLSPRTDKELFIDVCDYLEYKAVSFHAHDKRGKEIYHTNVMMSVAEKFAIICSESITNIQERKLVMNLLTGTGHRLIDITFEQMNHFAGNMLALQTNNNSNILALSQNAYNSLSSIQKQEMEKHCELVPLSLDTIEVTGGGSARCMIAELFLPQINSSIQA